MRQGDTTAKYIPFILFLWPYSCIYG
jgi:hypothetical protein